LPGDEPPTNTAGSPETDRAAGPDLDELPARDDPEAGATVSPATTPPGSSFGSSLASKPRSCSCDSSRDSVEDTAALVKSRPGTVRSPAPLLRSLAKKLDRHVTESDSPGIRELR
jgi:hypothetical protein